MIAPQIPRKKPTLLEIINGRRDVTMTRLIIAANVPRDTLLAVMRDNSATPEVATKIAAGLTKLTEHQVSVLDIDMAVHPSKGSCPHSASCGEYGCTGACADE